MWVWCGPGSPGTSEPVTQPDTAVPRCGRGPWSELQGGGHGREGKGATFPFLGLWPWSFTPSQNIKSILHRSVGLFIYFLNIYLAVSRLGCPGEGNGNPLQYSCLENPRDGGAWWAAIYGVTQSRTWLKWLSSSSSSSRLGCSMWGLHCVAGASF